MTNLLFDTAPLVVSPALACEIGLNEAIILQQINYWVNTNEKARRNYKDGHYWTYNTATEWQQQFPWWSEKTSRRAFTVLENSGLVITGTYNKAGFDRVCKTAPSGAMPTVFMENHCKHFIKGERPLFWI